MIVFSEHSMDIFDAIQFKSLNYSAKFFFRVIFSLANINK